MNAVELLRKSAGMSMMVMRSYVEDLDDATWMRRPGPGCNHIAWQIGHLISFEASTMELLMPGAGSELPPGFAEQHSKATAGIDDPSKFLTKPQYLDLFERVRAKTLTAFDKLQESDLDKPAPEAFRQFFPTAGDIYLLIANHPLMHAGQFIPIRRSLGLPAKF